MMRAAHGTGSQRESSGCTEGSPVRLAMVAAVAVIIVMPSLSAAQEPPETPTALSRLLDALVTWGFTSDARRRTRSRNGPSFQRGGAALAARGESPASHRDRSGARLTRREKQACSTICDRGTSRARRGPASAARGTGVPASACRGFGAQPHLGMPRGAQGSPLALAGGLGRSPI